MSKVVKELSFWNLLGGGIGENTPEVRKTVCDGLAGWEAVLDNKLNETTMHGDVCLSTADSKLAIWMIHSDEAMQLAFEAHKFRSHESAMRVSSTDAYRTKHLKS